jgi:hypothetical protein
MPIHLLAPAIGAANRDIRFVKEIAPNGVLKAQNMSTVMVWLVPVLKHSLHAVLRRLRFADMMQCMWVVDVRMNQLSYPVELEVIVNSGINTIT